MHLIIFKLSFYTSDWSEYCHLIYYETDERRGNWSQFKDIFLLGLITENTITLEIWVSVSYISPNNDKKLVKHIHTQCAGEWWLLVSSSGANFYWQRCFPFCHILCLSLLRQLSDPEHSFTPWLLWCCFQELWGFGFQLCLALRREAPSAQLPTE